MTGKEEEKAPQTAGEYYDRGNERFDNGDLDGAIADYSETIRLDPSIIEAWANRGSTWGRKDEHEKAKDDFDKAIDLDPNYASAWSNRSITWRNMGETDRAFYDSNEAIRLNRDLAHAWLSRGLIWKGIGSPDKAIEDLSEAIRLNPKDVHAWFNRGLAWKDKGEYDKAVEDLNKTIDMRPKEAIVWNSRGTVWFEKGELEKAIEDYDKALQLDPNFQDATHNRAVVLALQSSRTKISVKESMGADIKKPRKEVTYNRSPSKKSRNIALFLMWTFFLGWIGVFTLVFYLDVCTQYKLCAIRMDPYLFLSLIPAFTMTTALVSPLVWWYLRDSDRETVKEHADDPEIRSFYLKSLMKSDSKLSPNFFNRKP